jgi:hypothetical protein
MDLDLFGILNVGARLSADGLYRYELWRRWGDGRVLTWIMLNPSTADAEIDDPTIRRCVAFTKAWRYDAIRVVNLFALRATDPAELGQVEDPVGPENDAVLDSLGEVDVVAAWGAHAMAATRVVDLQARGGLPAGMRCLGMTKSGAPRHPLYVRSDIELVDWRGDN